MTVIGSSGTPRSSAQTESRDIALEARDLGHAYGGREVLAGVDFQVRRGTFACLVGPSGVGKTTLLRCLSGLQSSTSGSVYVGGDIVNAPMPGVALVFQDYSRSLMPWSSVLHNVMLPLRANGISKQIARAKATRALALVGLDDVAGQMYPWQLSGGMQQRVAIARALAYEPSLLLMDEPFASVDAYTRADLEDLMLTLQRELALTVVLVTHDIDEAVYLSDQVIALNGRPAQVADIVEVPLGSARDQVTTKSTAEFAELRARVHGLVRGSRGKSS
ncbi:MAG: cmpD 3 [Subtercola sp.]|nr:cmpD 3 [Subtercola sp.]